MNRMSLELAFPDHLFAKFIQTPVDGNLFDQAKEKFIEVLTGKLTEPHFIQKEIRLITKVATEDTIVINNTVEVRCFLREPGVYVFEFTSSNDEVCEAALRIIDNCLFPIETE